MHHPGTEKWDGIRVLKGYTSMRSLPIQAVNFTETGYQFDLCRAAIKWFFSDLDRVICRVVVLARHMDIIEDKIRLTIYKHP
jgi:hypothetical protein